MNQDNDTHPSCGGPGPGGVPGTDSSFQLLPLCLLLHPDEGGTLQVIRDITCKILNLLVGNDMGHLLQSSSFFF